MLLTLGYGLIGIGPLVAFFVPLLANKSFIVLLTFLSAFYWLVVLSLTSAVFRAFLPFHPSAGSYLGVLLVCVSIEELARLGIWRAHLSIIAFLEQHASRLGHVLRRLDRIYLAMGWGLGHATVHALFFHASFLPLTVQGGTWYADSCPAMNVFLAGALLTLGFNFLLIALMVLALEGHADIYSSKGLYSAVGSQLPQQQPPQQQQQQQRLQLQEDLKGGRGRQMGIAAAAHLVAALLMLLNFAHNGCLATVPLLLMLGLGSAWYAAKVFEQGKQAAGLKPNIREDQGFNEGDDYMIAAGNQSRQQAGRHRAD
mmetsp:Transcript_20362/g.56735  ORF Transcript_20362/g.56735 Transcript_20362/m.56735 type:complete len:313 (+) Transcript_20362:87-1025(+)|eukprot:CAMPEP_0202367358 /NCGR_PEP_ID=MMETSP1126-20121109/17606_1 /ASSEMBLY_ACC=CAM_ASM_000457 /TAXON_ID=3047 /ORGANISM="Dunaliella tertiolecta, Strain CCMP1320" /LENGTH=312 /DNA_ID=CAMNT_0048962601 /DNA_START=38 /DNA_END=976 /DNA_ORIENTATION=+